MLCPPPLPPLQSTPRTSVIAASNAPLISDKSPNQRANQTRGHRLLGISETRTYTNCTLLEFTVFRHDAVSMEELQFCSNSQSLPLHVDLRDIQSTKLFAVAARVTIRNPPLLIISVYLRPREALPLKLLKFASQAGNYILLGDLKVRSIDSGDSRSNPRRYALIDFLGTSNLARFR